MRAEEQVPMKMEDWAEQFEGILRLSKKEILTHAGSISAQIAEEHALSEFKKYRVKQDRLYQSDFDHVLLELEIKEVSDGKMNNKIYYHYCYVDTFYNIILKPRLRKWRFPDLKNC